MIVELTTAQIASRICVSERTIQRWLEEHRLQATPLKYNLYAVDTDDLERLRLPEHFHGTTRIQALERRVTHLAAEVDHLHAALAQLTTPTTRATRNQSRERAETPTSSELPNGLIGAISFGKQHGIKESTVRKAIASGRLPTEKGKWKVGRAIVQEALDEQGRQRFYEEYYHNEHFVPCAGCPHTKTSVSHNA